MSLCLLVCLLLTACAGEDDPDTSGRPIAIGMAQPPGLVLHTSRAEEIPALYPQTIGVFAFIEGNTTRVFDNQRMYYRYGKEVDASGIDVDSWDATNDWPYDPVKLWIPNRTYRFYAYAPYDAENADIVASGYQVSSFRMSNIPPISATEFMVCEQMVEVNAGTRPNFVMNHLTSRLRFLFAIDPEYFKLRTINIKKISITDTDLDNPHYWTYEADLSQASANFSLTETTMAYVPLGDIDLEYEGGDGELELSTDYAPFSSVYNLVNIIPSTTLTVVYDVYDKEGVLTRKDQTVSNLVNLSTKFTELKRGHCYDVRVLIAPKYLYVLSDNDVPPDCVMEVGTP